jgi:ribosomal protein S18 acetylase RimI-like enzyme
MTTTRDHETLLPNAAAVRGVTFRAYRGEADIADIADLMRACNAANGVTRNDSAVSMRLRFEAMTHVDPFEDVILAFADGRLVAFSSITWDDTTDGQRHYRAQGWVHPEKRRQGVGSAMWQRNERRIVEMAAGHPHIETRVLTTVLPERDLGGRALAAQNGCHRVRQYHHMVRPHLDDIDVPQLPPGLETRPMAHDILPALWAAANDAFREHFGADDTSEAAYQRWIKDPRLDLSLLCVAFEGPDIAGAVHGVIDAGENELQGYRRGWTDPIYVRQPWRRRGLASALIGRTLVMLRRRGMTSAQLDVDAQNANAAMSLYQRHGFEVDRSAAEWHKSLSM